MENLEFCCRCSVIFTEGDKKYESKLAPDYQNIRLCLTCLKKERKDIKRLGLVDAAKQLVAWYNAPKRRVIGAYQKQLKLQYGIEGKRAGQIVSAMMGYPDWDSLMVDVDRHASFKRPNGHRHAENRLIRAMRRNMGNLRRQYVREREMLDSAKFRRDKSSTDKTSGTMRSVVHLISTHNVPINETAARVVFKSYRV